MLQVGMHSVRGTGAVMVAGPRGVALVPEHLAEGAYGALTGRGEIRGWLSEVRATQADAALLDLSGPYCCLTLLGAATATAYPDATSEPVLWNQLWGAVVDPTTLERVEIRLSMADRGPWVRTVEDVLPASELCIGFPPSVTGMTGMHAAIPHPNGANATEGVTAPATGGPLSVSSAEGSLPVVTPEENSWPTLPGTPASSAMTATPADGTPEPVSPWAPDNSEESPVEVTVLRRHTADGVKVPIAFLVHSASAPVELTRDVVIGRDPNPHVLEGRGVALDLRVPSPATEISRNHCAVLSEGNGTWSVMDLGSANGTLLRRADGTMADLPPRERVSLTDGDLIDVGENTTIEFRVS